jgi:pantoate--beta-alanine ligase
MILFKKAMPLSGYLSKVRTSGRRVGFVPTMGALHNGHTALIEACKKDGALTVCSIFVNPMQFNNPTDFKTYPSTIERDIERLLQTGCDVLFLPNREEVYPPGYTPKHYALGEVETVLEGAFRPGHFQGVCQAVDRLVQIVEPQQLYFGQKDYQQCMVIKKLLSLTDREDIALNIMPTVREESGLALSSRNLRLTSETRGKAVAIYNTLTFLEAHIAEKPVEVLKRKGMDFLKSEGFDVDYVEIAHAATLQPVAEANGQKVVGLIAATIGGVRLIDNLMLN